MRQDLPWSIWQLPNVPEAYLIADKVRDLCLPQIPSAVRHGKNYFSRQQGVRGFRHWLESSGECLNTEAQSIWLSNRESATARSWLGLLRRLVVRSDDEARRVTVPPRPTAFPPAESVAVRASPCSRKDASSIAESTANNQSGFGAAKFHGTQLHDRGTCGGWTPITRSM
jgi:hypothetical protein